MLIGHTEGNKGLVRIVVKNRKPSVKVITSSPQVIYVQIPKKVFFFLVKKAELGKSFIISPQKAYIFTF